MARRTPKSTTESVLPPTRQARQLRTLAAGSSEAAQSPSTTPDDIASHNIRVLCVDDHELLVEGLKVQFAIKAGIEVVGRLETAARLIETAERLRPHAVLLDIEMPGPDAFEMADRLKRAQPSVRIIVLSAHIRDAYLTAAFRAGVAGYFSKSDALEDIVNGIHEVMRGQADSFVLGPKPRERCQLPAEVASHGHRHTRPRGEVSVTSSGAPMTPLASLTPREAEVLRLIGKGLSRTQIATQLCRSAKTIDAHQSRMMKKLGIDARADLVRFAIREGLAQA